MASLPDDVSSPPIRTLSGFIRSSIADPSAKNSGLEITSNFTLLLFELRVFLIFYAVPIGAVDFSTTILSDVETFEILFEQSSTYVRSVAIPFPSP